MLSVDVFQVTATAEDETALALTKVGTEGGVVSTALTPLPVKFSVCGLPAALSVMVKLPVLTPVAVGVKITLTVQLEAGTNASAV